MNIDVCTQPQHAIDDGAADDLFPATARWLTQHKLRHLALSGDLDQCFGNITTLRADHLGPQVFGKQRVRFQPALRSLAETLRVSAVLEPSYELAREGQLPLRLDPNGD